MLIKFQFKNYRSFRDEAVLSMEASGLSPFKECLIPMSSTIKLLPAAAIYGKKWWREKQCDSCLLACCTVYPQCTANAA